MAHTTARVARVSSSEHYSSSPQNLWPSPERQIWSHPRHGSVFVYTTRLKRSEQNRAGTASLGGPAQHGSVRFGLAPVHTTR